MFSYDVKVKKERTYLWGGASIERALLANTLHLICRVDEFGEEIKLFAEEPEPTGEPISYGTLQPNQIYIVPLNGMSGVYASTVDGQVDSLVKCSLIFPGSN